MQLKSKFGRQTPCNESSGRLLPHTLRGLVSIAVGLYGTHVLAAPLLPAGGAFVAGSGAITTGAQSVNIGQTSTRGVITWNSFDIGAGKAVTINNGTGATLNRVTGGVSSSILGTLTATGSVYLINPQGVVIGTSGVVTTGGRFVASALDVTNAAFMSGGALTFANGGNGAVVNLGKIGSSGGDVFLIARSTVSNQGTISAPKGTAELAAGSQVLLQDSASGQQVFVQAGSGGTVSNAGAINAAQANLQAADGNVYALAGNTSAIRATGTATRDGHVWLVADKGHVQIHDNVTATNADGTGGTVDSSGTTLNIGGSTVTAGRWNFTVPVSYSIDQTTASALSASLNKGTSVDFEANGSGSSVALNGAIGWNSDATLTLGAGRSVGIAKSGSISNTSSGDLLLRADSGGIDNNGSVVNRGKIDWSKSTGLVSALYDMNGSYTPGMLLSNAQWTAPQYSGEVTQITSYRLVNDYQDLVNVAQNLGGNYALGKNIVVPAATGTVAPAAGFQPIGPSEAAAFTGQFDGFGHSIDGSSVIPQVDAQYVGLFGVIGANGVVRNLNLTQGNASGLNSAAYGILAGRNDGTVAHVTSSGSVGTGSYASLGNGGLVGENFGTIARSSSSADVGDESGSGGLVGANYGTIVQSFASGETGGGTHGVQGGLAASNSGLITQSYATGGVGGYTGGGLVYNNTATGVIDQSFAVGGVGGGEPPGDPEGGIAATNAGVIRNNVYWNRDTTGRTVAAAINTGTVPPDSNGLNTAQMSNATSYLGWNIPAGGVWVMPVGATHPILQWQQAQP